MSHHGGHHGRRELRHEIHHLRNEIRHDMHMLGHQTSHHPIISHHGHHGHHGHEGEIGAALLVGGVVGAGVAVAATSPHTTTTMYTPPQPVYVPQPQSVYVQPTYVPVQQPQQQSYYTTQPITQQPINTYPQQASYSSTTQIQTQPSLSTVTPTQTNLTTYNSTTAQQPTKTTYQDNANYYGKESEPGAPTQVTEQVVQKTNTDLSYYNNLYQPVNPFYGTGTTTTVTQKQQQQPLQQQQLNPFYVYGDLSQKVDVSSEKKVDEVTTKLEQLKVTETLVWDQPLANCKPSLLPVQTPYSDEDALEDAKKLRAAMKGIGCDDKVIGEITGTRTHKQRLQIKKMYGKVDGQSGKERNLTKDLESELSGDFRKTVLPLYSDPGCADAKWMKDALDGRGYNADLLLEILCTRTSEQLTRLKEAWSLLDKKETLIKRVGDETSKFFSAGHFKTFCTTLLEANRPENGPVDDKAALADAEQLNRALSQEKKGDAKTVFVTIFTKRSWRHIAAVAQKFQQISKKFTLEAAIKHEWGDSETSKGLRIILEFVTAPYDFWAKKLQVSMAGLGTDDTTLQRIIVSRCEIDLGSVAEVFGERYGKGKTLKSWIEDDTSKNYQKLLLKLCGY